MEGSHPAFEVADEVLLVAALVGFADHLVGGELPVVGDVEEVAVFIEQDVVTPLDRQVLAQGDDAVVLGASARPVGELDYLLRLGSYRLVAALADDASPITSKAAEMSVVKVFTIRSPYCLSGGYNKRQLRGKVPARNPKRCGKKHFGHIAERH